MDNLENIMQPNLEKYKVLLDAISNYTKELEEINKKIEKMLLTKEEEKELNKIMSKYKPNELISTYLDKHIDEYKDQKRFHKYLKLFKRGHEIHEEITYLVNYVSSMDGEENE